MTWDQAAVKAVLWLTGLCLVAGIIALVGAPQLGDYASYFIAPAAVVVALLSRAVHGTWRVAAMVYLTGVSVGFVLAMLSFAL
jgi:hypothetical protein